MNKNIRSNVFMFLLLAVLLVGAFGGFIYWTLPMLGLEHGEREEQEAQLVPDTPSVQDEAPDQPAQTAGDRETEPVSGIVARVGKTVVKITTVKEQVMYDLFWGQTRGEVQGEGSGVIFDERGYILTNNHVVADADEITVFLNDEEGQARELKGQVLGRDAVTDLAVVKVDAGHLPIARLGNSDEIQPGNTAIAIGNPLGFTNTVTVGVISAINRDLPVQEETELVDLIQTDAAINPGNSGGALFNSRGEVIGINTAIIQGAQGIGFAIPANTAREVAAELIENGKVIRPWLGIYGTSVTTSLRTELALPETYGVYIDRTIPDGPVAKAGIRQHDIIQQLDQVKIETMEGLLRELRKHRVGDKVELLVSQNGHERHVTVTLTARPAEVGKE